MGSYPCVPSIERNKTIRVLFFSIHSIKISPTLLNSQGIKQTHYAKNKRHETGKQEGSAQDRERKERSEAAKERETLLPSQHLAICKGPTHNRSL